MCSMLNNIIKYENKIFSQFQSFQKLYFLSLKVLDDQGIPMQSMIPRTHFHYHGPSSFPRLRSEVSTKMVNQKKATEGEYFATQVAKRSNPEKNENQQNR